jgi:hypothetical protein
VHCFLMTRWTYVQLRECTSTNLSEWFSRAKGSPLRDRFLAYASMRKVVIHSWTHLYEKRYAYVRRELLDMCLRRSSRKYREDGFRCWVLQSTEYPLLHAHGRNIVLAQAVYLQTF